MSPSLEVLVCQLCSLPDKKINLDKILDVFHKNDFSSVDLICFPENSLFMRSSPSEKSQPLSLSDTAFSELSQFAKKWKNKIHLGSIPLLVGSQIYNASILLHEDGRIEHTYNKIHLFDVDIEAQKSIRESDTYTAGNDLKIFEIKGWKIAQTICYDLRFPELYAHYRAQNPDVILVPSAFLYATGKVHWEILLRARAIENQAFVVAAAQGGTHNGKHQTYGHSMVIGPWGEILAEIQDTDENKVLFVKTRLAYEAIEKARKQIPMHNHRKLSPHK